MRKYLYTIFLLIPLLFIASCSSNDTTGPVTATKGSVFITSNPSGAQVWQNGSNTNKVTPDSITGLDAGTYNFTLKLTGYKDTLVAATVTAGQTTTLSVNMTSSATLTTYNARIWETNAPGPNQPSGLSLSLGQAISLAGTDKAKSDIIYESVKYIIRSASGWSANLTRETFFKQGTGTDLLDKVASPLKDASWVTQMTDRETNYFFLYDADKHYSKLKIIGYGTTPLAYVDLQWIYNGTVDDPRF
ncbi:MAG: PEGA domain-containing protein [Bacteroidota bacterium]|nr:PEGA domain-containing protein [Bacteroidota bacterium]